MRVVWRSLRRRWYLVLALAVLTVGATFLVAQRVGETYEATGTVLVFPPSQAEDPTGAMTQENPYLALGGVNQARDVVVRALTSKKIADEFGETYPSGTTFEIAPDFTNSAPIILFTVEARDTRRGHRGADVTHRSRPGGARRRCRVRSTCRRRSR